MRIVTWNCCGSFASKANELLALDPDIAIVPESSRADAEALKEQGYESIWFGDNVQRGLAVLYKSSWAIRPIGPSLHKWIIPLEVSGAETFTLIAVWAWQDGGGPAAYVKVIRKALAEHPEWLATGPVVMAGDFNSHWRWDKAPTNEFASLVAHLADHRLLSAYHAYHDESGGSETRPTFHQNWKVTQPFHIDYIFIPAEWKTRLGHFEVGPFDHWLRFSDHCPLTLNVSAL